MASKSGPEEDHKKIKKDITAGMDHPGRRWDERQRRPKRPSVKIPRGQDNCAVTSGEEEFDGPESWRLPQPAAMATDSAAGIGTLKVVMGLLFLVLMILVFDGWWYQVSAEPVKREGNHGQIYLDESGSSVGQEGRKREERLREPQRRDRKPPDAAQRVDQRDLAVLERVPAVDEFNRTSLFLWPGVSKESLLAKPFHVYDDAFLDIIGPNPSLTRIASSEHDPLFHEAVVWNPPTDEVFFVQNAGAKAAGTGLHKSAVIQKISLAEAERVRVAANSRADQSDTTVDVTVVQPSPVIVNANGATNYNGNFLFAAEGQGESVPSALYLMNPREPYNTTVLLNNYFGRQFSSLNDVAMHPTNGDLYFTDVDYGYMQDFRPRRGLPNQMYRYSFSTGAIAVVADGFMSPNGLTFSPDGAYAYVSDTGANHAFFGYNFSDPASIYRYNVMPDGTLENRKTFAYILAGIPDGIHCDSNGNLYAGCGDGVQVWNPSGVLLGKLYHGGVSANFQFVGNCRMVICAETELWYARIGADGSKIASL